MMITNTISRRRNSAVRIFEIDSGIREIMEKTREFREEMTTMVERDGMCPMSEIIRWQQFLSV